MVFKKKLMAITLSTFMAFSAVACSNNAENETATTPASKTEAAATEKAAEADPTEQNTEDQEQSTTDKIKITYANWNLGTVEENNIQRQMIQAFNDMSTTTEVIVVEEANVGGEDYVSMLNTLAAAGNFPDVTMMRNIPEHLANKWAADITTVAEADPEWSTVNPSLVDGATFNGKVMAIPFAMHFAGLFINKDLFEKANVDLLSYGYTLDDLDEAIDALNQPANGIVAVKHEADFVNWLPSVYNDNFGFFSYDGTKFNLDSQEFKDGVTYAKSLRTRGATWNGLSADQKTNFTATNDWEAWTRGEAAICYEGTWQFGGYGSEDLPLLAEDVRIIGLPNGKSVTIPDYIGISASCQNVSNAYDFAKWMSFGKDGYLKRIEIAKELELGYLPLPIVVDQDVINTYLDFIPIDGLKELYDNIDKSFAEPVKFIPGYVQARWEYPTGLALSCTNAAGELQETDNANIGFIVNHSVMGDLNYPDYSAQVNELSNRAHQDALAAIK